MKKAAALVLAFGLTSCMSAGTPRVVTQTPASISFECTDGFGCSSKPQDIADAAQTHCRKFGKNAQQSILRTATSGNFVASYVCV